MQVGSKLDVYTVNFRFTPTVNLKFTIRLEGDVFLLYIFPINVNMYSVDCSLITLSCFYLGESYTPCVALARGAFLTHADIA